jgi:antitoxin component YwqK of YwqJK toxin-antitoxin module
MNELGEKRLKVLYDEEGELWHKEEYDENGNEIYYIDYENYKGERRLYSKREYNENGDITLDYRLPLYGIYRHEYEYDAYGQLLRSTEYIKEYNTERTYKYQYEYKFSNGRLYRVLANGKELYAYDDEGRLKSASTLRSNTIKSKTEYDENGNKTLEIKYGFKGVIESKTAWENGEKTLEESYKNGTVTERKIYKNGKNVLAETYTNGVLQDKEVWEYDASGKTMLYESYSAVSGGLMLRKKWEYNEYGKIKQILQYDDNGDYYVERMYTYDENGNETLRVDYDQNGETSGRVEYTYNGNGDLLSETHYNKNEKVVSKKEREYDFDGNLILIKSYELSVYTENGKKVTNVNKGKRVLEYDGKGRITLRADYRIDENGEEILCEKEINEYDKYGNIIYESKCVNHSQYGEKTTETEYVLEYDEDGFVISSTTYINGVLRWEEKYTDPIVLYKPKDDK